MHVLAVRLDPTAKLTPGVYRLDFVAPNMAAAQAARVLPASLWASAVRAQVPAGWSVELLERTFSPGTLTFTLRVKIDRASGDGTTMQAAALPVAAYVTGALIAAGLAAALGILLTLRAIYRESPGLALGLVVAGGGAAYLMLRRSQGGRRG